MCAKRGGKHEFARMGADLSQRSNWTARASKREGLPPKRLPKQLPLHSHLAAEAATSAERSAVSAADGQEAPPPLVAIRCGGWFEDCGGGCVDGAQPWLLLCGVWAMESRKGQTWDELLGHQKNPKKSQAWNMQTVRVPPSAEAGRPRTT